MSGAGFGTQVGILVVVLCGVVRHLVLDEGPNDHCIPRPNAGQEWQLIRVRQGIENGTGMRDIPLANAQGSAEMTQRFGSSANNDSKSTKNRHTAAKT